MTYNTDTQKLIDIFENTRTKKNWARIYCKDGDVIEAYADCFTYVTIGDDEDVDALLFVKRDGSLIELGGVEIDRFEILEKR